MTYAIPLGRIADHGRGSLGFGTTADVAAPGNLMTDDSDAGLVTIAGTGTGKGVSQGFWHRLKSPIFTLKNE
jgi:hypothetical protein